MMRSHRKNPGTVQRDDHIQARRSAYLFRFTTSTLRRQAALMMGRDAHGRGDLPLNASSAMSGVDPPQVRRINIDSLVVTSRGSCAPLVRDYLPQ
jgi:hypothetical protein